MGVGLRFLGRRILVTEEVVPFEKGRCLFFDLLLRDSSKLSFLSCQISNRGPYPFPSLLSQIFHFVFDAVLPYPTPTSCLTSQSV